MFQLKLSKPDLRKEGEHLALSISRDLSNGAGGPSNRPEGSPLGRGRLRTAGSPHPRPTVPETRSYRASPAAIRTPASTPTRLLPCTLSAKNCGPSTRRLPPGGGKKAGPLHGARIWRRCAVTSDARCFL